MLYLIKQTHSNSAYGALDLFTWLQGGRPGIKAPGKVTFGSSLKIKCWLSADAVNKGNGVESEGGKTRTLVCACRELCAPPYTRGESELVRRTGRVFSILTLSPETEKLHSAASKS